ncbi:hypothetical protein Drorol1_Dr00019333, partial [Drosera rotundifolia]
EMKRFDDQLYLPWLALFHCYPLMDTVVLYPSPGMGHLVSMVKLGKLLLLQHPSVSVTILTTPFPFSTSVVSMFIAGVTSAIPSISNHSLPPVSLSQELSSYFNMEQITFDILRLNDSNVRDALASLSSNISSIIVDMFCSSAVPLAAQFCPNADLCKRKKLLPKKITNVSV